MYSRCDVNRREFVSSMIGGIAFSDLKLQPSLERKPQILRPWVWPNNAKAAVSLSYDDDYLSHLDLVIPDLRDVNICGTFYLPVGIRNVELNLARWKQAYKDGHEIGSHTVSHPSVEDLAYYTTEDIQDEVGYAALWLNRYIGPDKDRTFCYPNGVLGIGPNNRNHTAYEKAVARRHIAARVSGGGPNNPFQMYKPNNLLMIGAKVPKLGNDEADFQELTNYFNQTVKNNSWAVYYFHEIVENPTNNPLFKHENHRRLLSYLRESTEKIWIAPVGKIARYIIDNL